MPVSIEAPLRYPSNGFNENPNSISDSFYNQMAVKLSAGFAGILGKTDDEYLGTFYPLFEQAKQKTSTGIPIFVETRVPFSMQAEKLGISIDNTVFRIPEIPAGDPYVAWVKIVSNPQLDPIDFVKRVSEFSALNEERLVLATALEAIQLDMQRLLSHSFVYVEGVKGQPLFGQRLLTIDSFLGHPRVTNADWRKYDPSISALGRVVRND